MHPTTALVAHRDNELILAFLAGVAMGSALDRRLLPPQHSPSITLIHLPNPAEARAGVFEYIEVFYNRIRRHSSLGYLSPEQFEERYRSAPAVAAG